MHYIAEKLDKKSLRDIVQEANKIITQIPHASEIQIFENTFFNIGSFLLFFNKKGYYYVMFVGDHAEVYVSFWGKTIQDVVKNLIWNEVITYCQIISAKSEKSLIDVINDFWSRYRNVLHFEDFVPPENDLIFNEIYIPNFIKKNQDQLGTFNINSLIIITNERHRLFFHPKVGYYYSKPIDSTRIELSFIGMNESDAFSWIRHNILISKSSGTLFDHFFKIILRFRK